MKLTILNVGVLLILILLGTCAYLFKRNNELSRINIDKDITIRSMATGIQEYKAKDSTWNVRLLNERRSAEDIKDSRDSIIAKMRDQLKNANIKLQNALSIAYVDTEVTVDTVIKYRPVKVGTKIDTLLDFSKLPHIENTVKLTDTTATNKLVIKNEQYILTNADKEFVKPRKAFFLWRWFQRKHWVIYTDIHNSNPYITTKNARFITIVDKEGRAKTIEK